jgi:oligopeptide transport system substrate-binding protein
MTDTRFKDVRVRQAFNYALNRDKIGQNILRNQFSELGYFGITPPIYSVFKGYDFNRIKEVCYAYDPVKAQKLLAEAGYPNGKGFGTVMLRFNIDEKHSSVAQEFAQQIGQNLGINVNIDGSTFEQKEEDGARGNGDIFRSAWNGDYVSPESFLSIFYGKNIPSDSKAPSYINKSRYHNPLFDHFFENAKNSNRMPEALENYGKAERILMQDPPIIPLWYMGDIQLVYSNVRNLNFNVLNIFSFKKVYKKDWTLEEYTKATK